MIEQIRAPFAIWKVGEEEFKLKLKTSEIERLERQYGIGNIMNPMLSAGETQLPSLVYMLDIIHGALQKYHHGYSRVDVSDLYDDYLDAGGNQTELIKVVMDIFRASGFFPSQSEKKGKLQTPQAE